ncbi:MAG: ABC transporter permease [Chloroflexaceae bacterium]|nr:ABC transporter permease [Chloroflexaceae bacterium]
MDIFLRAYSYALGRGGELADALGRHMLLVAIALGVGLLVCVPLGMLTARSRLASFTIINAVNGLRVIPSIAILFLAIPYFGLSLTSAAIALTVLAMPPILINTDAAFRKIDPAVREAAFGMGMSAGQVLRQIEIPLALPVVLAGVRTASTEVIASATLAAFIGAGGLGIYITRGFALYDTAILLVGAIPVALLALAAELGVGAVQRVVQPPTH